MNHSLSVALIVLALSSTVATGCDSSTGGGSGSEGSENGSGGGSGGAAPSGSGNGGGSGSGGNGGGPAQQGSGPGQQSSGPGQQSSGPVTGSTGAVDENTVYIPEQDPAKAQEIITRMWTILTTPPCWNQDGLPFNYTFSGVSDYRYSGNEITSGQVVLNSVGSFGGYDMADVYISSTQYWIGIYDSQTIAMSFFHDNGELVTSWFTAAAPGSYCV